MMLAVGAKYRNLRSSMLSAIERGRPPSVDFLNGEIVDRAAHHEMTAPVNAAATALVHAIARGERRSGHDTLRWLADQPVT
jgi:2-dehydropantoate 2-reductase